jgi:uncharacterized membrane protein
VKAAHATRFKRACRWGAAALLGIGYSLLAHRAAASPTPGTLDALVAVVPVLGLAFLMAWRSSQRAIMLALFLAGCAALSAMSAWLISHSHWIFLLQHAGMYALLFGAFGRTLLPGRTPMVTGFARMVHRTLSPALIRYTRAVTWAWTVFFGSTAALSLLLFWLAPMAVWSAFANLLGAPLLVLMFAAEYAVRCAVLPPADRAGPLAAIRAFRQSSSGGTAHQP